MSMFATPKVPTSGYPDELGKDDLVNALAVFKVDQYDPQTPTKYGSSATITCVVHVVDGPHAGVVENRFYAAGNLAKQIGTALDQGQMAPGRIVTGQSATGRSWYGIEWATKPEDLAAAERAVTPRPATLGEQAQAVRTRIHNTPQPAYDADAPF